MTVSQQKRCLADAEGFETALTTVGIALPEGVTLKKCAICWKKGDTFQLGRIGSFCATARGAEYWSHQSKSGSSRFCVG